MRLSSIKWRRNTLPILGICWIVLILRFITINSPGNHLNARKKLTLFVAIHSAPRHLERRNANRETWLSECENNPDAVCRFFTDGQDPDGKPLIGEERKNLENESRVYGDLILTEVRGGVNFAIKYLWIMEWMNKSYDVQYFLRLDDDYFICFKRLMLELEIRRPTGNFQWGWLHCESINRTVLDSGFYLVTRNIVDSFLSRRDSLQCLVWEAQAIGYWLKNVSNLTTFADNKRILHKQRGFSSETEVSKRKEICHSVLAIHKSYPEKMRLFWSVYLREESVNEYEVPPISYACKYPIGMDISAYRNPRLFNIWYSELKPCKDNPTWNRGKIYKGRGHV